MEMRKVWAVLKEIPYEGATLHGVFDNERDAQLAAVHPYDSLSVVEVDLNTFVKDGY